MTVPTSKSVNKITIALDAMGGDHGPSIIVPAALQVLKAYDHLQLILVGDMDTLKRQIDQSCQNATLLDRITVRHASQQVEMAESAAHALRTKKDSSMRVAINLVKDKVADACVSAGNTGALMATARFVLKTLPGVDRPAIMSTFPTWNDQKNVRILDLGANVDSSAQNLLQFAVMGSVVTSAVDNILKPKICLLNIGIEEIKGNEQVKEAAVLLTQTTGIFYAGYIEGDALYKGDADVIVCDGFVGNVALKTTEGVSKFIAKLIKKAFYQNTLTKIAGLIAKPVLKSLTRWIDPDRYNGASLIGLRGIVIKSHGGANTIAFANAIKEAIKHVEKNVPQLISAEVENLLKMPSSPIN
jgi:glycerol-3-phosphate acyltransferase PlsX